MKRTAIKRKVALRASGALSRTPLRPVSARRKAEQKIRRRNLIAAYGESPVCWVRFDQNCTGWADSAHEIVKRSAGGSITDVANCVPCCNHCNSAIEDRPLLARERGWAIPSWDRAK